MTWITEHWDTLILLVGQLLATAVIVVKLTPSTTDDEWLAKVQEIFTNITKPKA
jgi:trans-aconitate methyltransferase